VTVVLIVDQQLTRELRRRVLRPQLPPDAPMPGDDEPDAVHFAALDDAGTVLSTCLISPDPCPWLPGRPAWHLRQMATLELRRGGGHGRAVVEAAAAQAAAAGGEVLWCNAREGAVGFYARLGFRPHGSVFTDAAHPIPHLRMWRELAAAAEPPVPATSSAS
jgi:GNAT superfamily N-acetyltransferase